MGRSLPWGDAGLRNSLVLQESSLGQTSLVSATLPSLELAPIMCTNSTTHFSLNSYLVSTYCAPGGKKGDGGCKGDRDGVVCEIGEPGILRSRNLREFPEGGVLDSGAAEELSETINRPLDWDACRL